MPTTPRGAPYPAEGGSNNTPADIKALAEWASDHARSGAPLTTVPRWAATFDIAMLPGHLHFAPMWLDAGQRITALGARPGGTPPAGHTNHWFGVYDQFFNKLAVTVDGGSSDWSGMKFLQIVGGFTVPQSGWYWLGIMLAGSECSVMGTAGGDQVTAVPFGSGGRTSSGGLTTPATAPDDANVIQVPGNNPIPFIQLA